MFKRQLRLELTGGGLEMVIEDLRMDFSIREFMTSNSSSVGNNFGDWCTIEVYNLGVDSYKTLVGTSEVDVKLSYKYADSSDYRDLFSGVMTTVKQSRKLPESKTTLWCVVRQRKLLDKPVSATTDDAGTFSSAVKAIADNVGVTLNIDPSVSDSIKNNPCRNRSYMGIAKTELAKEAEDHYCALVFKDTSIDVVRAFSEGDTEPSTNHKKHKLRSSLIRGTPEAGVNKMHIFYSLETDFRCGEVIDFSEFIDSETSPTSIIGLAGVKKTLLNYTNSLEYILIDQYQIKKLMHTGSNYSDQFITELELIGNGKSSDN